MPVEQKLLTVTIVVVMIELQKLVSVFICSYSMTLEWNDLGLIENAFSVFCDGVGANGTLLTLDMRSNQISHVGAGELANALKRNSTLHTLGTFHTVDTCLCFFYNLIFFIFYYNYYFVIIITFFVPVSTKWAG